METLEEQGFWMGAAEALCSQKTEMQNDVQPSMLELLKENSVRLYAVDMTTGWFRVGGTTQGAMLSAWAAMKGSPRLGQVKSVCAQAISAAPQMGAAQDDPAWIARLMSGVCIATTGFLLFDLVRQQMGTLEGHWMYFTYTGQNGDTLCRPMYKKAKDHAFMPPGEVMDAAAQVAMSDQLPGSNNLGEIQRMGGLKGLANFHAIY